MPRRAAVAKLLSAVLASAVAGGGVNATRFASGSVDAAEPGRFAAGWICTHVVGACREAAGGAERGVSGGCGGRELACSRRLNMGRPAPV